MSDQAYVIPLNKLGLNDIDKVGGKNASLGEMITHLTDLGVKVPSGFATTAFAYQEFLQLGGLKEKINDLIKDLDVDDVSKLQKSGAQIRKWILNSSFQPELVDSVRKAYEELSSEDKKASFAVRSSATAEDLPDASFAGQQETYLNISGLDNILTAMKEVFASLFTDRAIAYRAHQGFAHENISLSVGVQKMVRSDLAASGVLFTIDTESGFDKVIFITSSYGLGETVVQGSVNPDEFYAYKDNVKNNKPAVLRKICGSKQQKMVFQSKSFATRSHEAVTLEEVLESEQNKFSITDEEITKLAEHALKIEAHYKRPMDIEWAKDGNTNELYIVQARPETVKSREDSRVMERFQMLEKSNIICEGRSIGQKIGKGKARVISSIHDMDKVQPGEVLVTDMTDPDWEPVMKRSSAIVTNRGGRTCHAAIIAREMGIPAVVGCQDATDMIKDDQLVTVSCAEGDVGFVYDGSLKFERKEIKLDKMPDIPFKIMMNVGNPERAFSFAQLPNFGVGLARLEFIISQMIGIHPEACIKFATLDKSLQDKISEKTAAYESPVRYYIEKLAEGIATLGAAFYPKPVIIRFSDFKSNEYANLLGGQQFEPHEENPMLGFRGASRYSHPQFQPCFALECEAVKIVRDVMGFTNIETMIPFVRTVKEAQSVLEEMKKNGLERKKNGLRVIMMCELPTNALLADEYLDHFDGFSIGSNDLTQLTLGLDRDSGIVAGSFDERDKAVKKLISMAIEACKKRNKYIGICGQGPSDHPDLAQWLIEQGIDSVSLNPDTVLETWLFLAKN
jgi:pyruvate,water dikinase